MQDRDKLEYQSYDSTERVSKIRVTYADGRFMDVEISEQEMMTFFVEWFDKAYKYQVQETFAAMAARFDEVVAPLKQATVMLENLGRSKGTRGYTSEH